MHDVKTIIDENLLSKNENDIAHKLSSIKGNKGYFPVYKKLQEKFKEYKKLVCSVTIDVTPFLYTKSDRYFKMLIEQAHLKKGSIAYDKYITKQ